MKARVQALESELAEKVAKSGQLSQMHSVVEADLRKQIASLESRLSSSMVGRQSESEMFQEAIMKAAHMEKATTEMKAKV